MINFWGSNKNKSFGTKFKGITPTNSPFTIKKKIKKVVKKKDMTWTQAHKKYPKMNPLGDYDKDGVKNWMDCKPFDKKRQGFQHEYSFSSVASKKIKTVKMPPELFLKTTWGETQRDAARLKKGIPNITTLPYKKYKMALLHGGGGIIQSSKYPRPYPSKLSYPRMSKEIGIRNRISGVDKYKQHVPIPFLTFNEKGKAVGHEGRHTAITAQRIGLEYIPVTIQRPKNTKLTTKYEILEEVEGKQYEDYNKQEGPYDRTDTTIHVEDLEEHSFAKKMRLAKEAKAMERQQMMEIMEEKAEERQQEQDNWEKAQAGELTDEDVTSYDNQGIIEDMERKGIGEEQEFEDYELERRENEQ